MKNPDIICLTGEGDAGGLIKARNKVGEMPETCSAGTYLPLNRVMNHHL